MSDTAKRDWFARITAIIGLLIACAAVAIPQYHSIVESKEALSITAIPEMDGGIIRISDDIHRTQAVQIPWVFTLSNTGKVTLSITSYSVEQILGQGIISVFPGLDGGATDGNNKFFPFPQTLAPGQSVAFRVHIGFIPTQTVQQKLRDMYAKSGPVHYQPAFAALAREGVTLYGGKAEYKELPEDGGVIISIDPSSYKSDPVYKISFTSGRGNVWQIVTAETAAKLQQITP